MPAHIRRHILVRGRVQGVGFRYWARAAAERAGLSGWIRNRSDGSVEAEFEGTVAAVEGMIDAVHRGPAGGAVDSVAVSDAEPEGTPAFRVLPDAG